ncbi:right-handed parallel beta-helix repeat-containing protein [Pseudarthrobacter sp. HLT3-5]|uniref:right-handed parallel beta-helix repeat-containing protein n=1 Tax=Pseudarthrobacter cellobiosi TaxID=2953654 RepID=UPI00208F6F3D|nr:right-handed parallel beta-helix repeat-containing protein [Pseudarthrobacter sp. HLT3-5]MCO4276145.1 right-handed parallel beta-helix repeat-containing protein [Pseudarthrobacter sp. HLT3-5]
MPAKSVMPRKKRLIATLLAFACLLVIGDQPFLNADTGALPARTGGGVEQSAQPSAVRKGELLNPKDAPYNAKGDGVTDDSAALQAWLTAGGTRLADGTYRIVTGLTLAGNNRRFFTENAKILADKANITALTVTGNNANIRAHVDGNNKAAYGASVTGAGAVIENGRYENFRSTTQSARGIDVRTAGGVTVRNNVIRNVVSVGDTTLGNGNGASRGIVLSASATATAASVILANRIENITGEEGDAIQVLFFDGTSSTPFNSGRTTVSDNDIRNVSRRFIKIQASDVTVQRNKLNFYLTTTRANPSSAISIIQSEYVKVLGNEINTNLTTSCIAVTGASGTPLRGIEIRDNVLRQEEEKTSVGIYLSWTTSPIVRDNSIYGGGVPVWIGSSTNALATGNAPYPGVAASR